MKYWAVNNNGKIEKVGASGFMPKGAIAEIPPTLLNKAIKIEDGEVVFDPIGQQLLDNKKAAIEAAQAHEEQVQKRIKAIRFGERMKAEISLVNLSKGWDQSTWDNYILEPAVQQISALLTDGFIQTARNAMDNVDLNDYYTQEEVDTLLSKMDVYLGE